MIGGIRIEMHRSRLVVERPYRKRARPLGV